MTEINTKTSAVSTESKPVANAQSNSDSRCAPHPTPPPPPPPPRGGHTPPPPTHHAPRPPPPPPPPPLPEGKGSNCPSSQSSRPVGQHPPTARAKQSADCQPPP